MLMSSVSNFPHSLSSLCSCRAATIQAETDGQLWAMDRQTFRRILLKSAFRKRKMYEALLDSVPMLKTLQVRLGFTRCSAGAIFDHITNGYGVIFFRFSQNYERMNLADALIPRTFTQGERIIKQGKHRGPGGSVRNSRSITRRAQFIYWCRVVPGLVSVKSCSEIDLFHCKPSLRTWRLVLSGKTKLRIIREN